MKIQIWKNLPWKINHLNWGQHRINSLPQKITQQVVCQLLKFFDSHSPRLLHKFFTEFLLFFSSYYFSSWKFLINSLVIGTYMLFWPDKWRFVVVYCIKRTGWNVRDNKNRCNSLRWEGGDCGTDLAISYKIKFDILGAFQIEVNIIAQWRLKAISFQSVGYNRKYTVNLFRISVENEKKLKNVTVFNFL